MGHQLAIDYQRTQRGKVWLPFTQLRHRDWLRLVPHFCFAGELSVRIADPETHCYIGADTLRLNTLPYRAGCTARYPLIGQFRKNSRAAGRTLRRGQPIKFSTPIPYCALRT